METDCGARDGHCQHDTDRRFAFTKKPGQRNPQSWRETQRAPGSWHPWEMGAGAQRTRVRGKPCLPPVPLLTQVPWSEKQGNPLKHTPGRIQAAAACQKEGEDEHGRMGTEAELPTGGMDR